MMAGATYPSVFSALTAIAREEGWQALYRCAPLLDSHSSPLCRRIHRAPMLRSVPGGPSTPGVLHWSCGTVARPATPFSQLVKARVGISLRLAPVESTQPCHGTASGAVWSRRRGGTCARHFGVGGRGAVRPCGHPGVQGAGGVVHQAGPADGAHPVRLRCLQEGARPGQMMRHRGHGIMHRPPAHAPISYRFSSKSGAAVRLTLANSLVRDLR